MTQVNPDSLGFLKSKAKTYQEVSDENINKYSIVVIVALFSVMAYSIITASGNALYTVVKANGILSPTAWVYLPYINKQEPPTPTATLTPTPTPQPTVVQPGVYILPNYSSYYR